MPWFNVWLIVSYLLGQEKMLFGCEDMMHEVKIIQGYDHDFCLVQIHSKVVLLSCFILYYYVLNFFKTH